MNRVAVVLVAVLLATQPVGAAVASGPLADADATPAVQTATEATQDAVGAAAQAEQPTIQKHIELHRTPEEPGAVDVSVTYDVPDPVTSLRVTVPADARDVDSTSFARTPDGYEWDGTTDPAELRFTMPANQTASGARSPAVQADGDYSFVDVGEWALVTVPGLSTRWEWRSAEDVRVTLSESVAVAGEGSTGGEIAYLGPVEEYTHTASDQTFTLAVPEHATLAATAGEILNALEDAASRVHVGARDDGVWFAAAPTSADWGVRGVEYGGSDAWVRADSRLDEASNVWFHEYIHTRQAFRTEDSGRWVTEASAEYYAGLLALRTDRVGFEAFRTYLSNGDRSPWRDAVLSDPDSWASGANYLKGSLVWGELDRRTRLATNSSATMADVLWRLNRLDGRARNADVLEAVLETSSASVEEYANRYTNTQAVPRMWDRSQHAAAFSAQPPRMDLDVREYRVTGPFRNETFASPPTLYVGETVTLEGAVTNDGGLAGEYAATLSLADDVLAAVRGELAPGATDQVTLRHELAAAGTYNVSAGRNPVPLDVREPGNVSVSGLSVAESTVEPGSDVTATVTLSNPSSEPATGPVAVTLDGETVASVDAALAGGGSATRTVAVTLSERGEYTLAAGGESVTVTASERPGGTGTGIPGFGIPAALVAALAAALLARRRR